MKEDVSADNEGRDSGMQTRRSALRSIAIGAGAGAIAGFAGGFMAGQREPHAPVVRLADRKRFVNKVVLITGATSGIGEAAAKMFAAEGAKVAFCGRRTDRGQKVQESIQEQGGEATYIRADVRIERDVQHFVDAAVEKYGGLDVCFNNAGITIERPLHDYTLGEWDDVINTDLRGSFLALKYEVPHLMNLGGGVVVVTSSSTAIATTEKRAAYSAAKRGLVGMVQAAAQDYYDKGIRINVLIPGTTDTELTRRAGGMMNAPDDVWETAAAVWAKANVPVAHRMAKPEEIAAFALALASDEFSYLTGAQLVIDGGKTAHA